MVTFINIGGNFIKLGSFYWFCAFINRLIFYRLIFHGFIMNVIIIIGISFIRIFVLSIFLIFYLIILPIFYLVICSLM